MNTGWSTILRSALLIGEGRFAILRVLRAFAVPLFSFRFSRFWASEKSVLAIVLISFLLMGMDGPTRENDEQRQLEEKQEQLAARIDALKEEQDFLQFQKAIAGSDSKYILFDLSAGTGILKYRNRILRTFGFTLTSPKPHQLRKGRYLLSEKTEGSPAKMSLTVSDSFIIQGRRYSGKQAGEKKLPRIIVDRKDLAALFYAIEKGTMLYVIR